MRNAVVLIPSYEPDEELINVVKSLHQEDFPILIVNDGSSSDFDPIFKSVEEYVQYVKQEPNKGKGAALKLGFGKIAELFPEAKYVITADGDGQHSTKDIIRVYDELNKRDELVFGVRKFDENTPAKSKLGNAWSRLSRSMLTKQYISDDQCGLRGFPVRYLKELEEMMGWRYEYEMNQITLFQLKHYKIYTIEIETIYLENNSKSHFSPFIDTCKIQGVILLQSLLSLIDLSLLVTLIIIEIDYGFNLYGSIAIGYAAVYLWHAILMAVVYPSKAPRRRMAIEFGYMLLKMGLALLLLFIFVGLLHLPHQIFVPIVVIPLSALNTIIPRIINRIRNR
ncbi:MAG: glycosyltransferase family 2 protein [Bacilli bacterium]|nr:glycosyltransferase family 2 protein [Bacilli bacterium]